MKRPLVLAVLVLVLIAGILAGVRFWPAAPVPPASQAPPNAVVAEQATRSESAADPVPSPSLGPLLARVQIVEFFDPACEACRAFHPYVKEIMEANAGRTRLVLRYAPFHRGSDYVIRVLEAARMQGQDIYWKVLDAVLAAQPQWADHARPQPEEVWRFLGGTDLDIERARRDMNHPRITQLISQDTAEIVARNVQKTPTFFINDKPLQVHSPEGLAAQVTKELGPD